MMEEAGARLKKIRLEKGISLEEVQKKTKINLKVLKAIEGDSLTNLSPVYLKSFLKIYCRFLGLDPQGYISEHKETILKSPAGAPAKKAAAIKLKSLYLPKKIRVALLIVLIAVVLSLVLFNLGKFLSVKNNPFSPPAAFKAEIRKGPKEPKPQKQKAKSPAAPARAEAKENRPLKEVSSGIRLGIRAKENCWVSLKADGKSLFYGVLEKGRLENWSAKDKIELSLGNAGAVELEVNGQLFTNLGRKNQPRKNIVITKEGLNIGK